MVSMTATQKISDEKSKPNGFDSAANVVRNGQKDFLRSIRFTFEWARESVTALKNVKPISALVTGIKGAEDYLAFGEFFQATCKVASSVTNALKNGVTKSFSSLKTSALEFIWNLFKVMKCLKNYGVFVLSKTIFTPLMAVGGISFAINSADKALIEIRAGNEVLKKKVSERTLFQKINPFRLFTSSNNASARKKELALRDARVVYHLYKIAKNVGTLAVGIIVILKALFAFTAPGVVMLTLGTLILISNTAASIIKESYHLK